MFLLPQASTGRVGIGDKWSFLGNVFSEFAEAYPRLLHWIIRGCRKSKPGQQTHFSKFSTPHCNWIGFWINWELLFKFLKNISASWDQNSSAKCKNHQCGYKWKLISLCKYVLHNFHYYYKNALKIHLLWDFIVVNCHCCAPHIRCRVVFILIVNIIQLVSYWLFYAILQSVNATVGVQKDSFSKEDH